MNKRLKSLQNNKILETLGIAKTKRNLSKAIDSNIIFVAYVDKMSTLIIGNNSGKIYTTNNSNIINNLKNGTNFENQSINEILNNITVSNIQTYFKQISINEVRKIFNNMYVYCWTANNQFYGVNKREIRNLDSNKVSTNIDLFSSVNENIFSNDRGVIFDDEKKTKSLIITDIKNIYDASKSSQEVHEENMEPWFKTFLVACGAEPTKEVWSKIGKECRFSSFDPTVRY